MFFFTPDGLYQYKFLLFRMENSPATNQRLVNNLMSNLDGCQAYIDDAIIFSEEWEQHLQTIRTFFNRLSEAKLTVNLAKCEFCHANLTFLVYIVGQGQVKPVEAKVGAISDFLDVLAKGNRCAFSAWLDITGNSVITSLS